MVSLVNIPVEVILDIVQYILNEDLLLPKVGGDAAWVIPPPSNVIWKQRRGRHGVPEVTDDIDESQEDEEDASTEEDKGYELGDYEEEDERQQGYDKTEQATAYEHVHCTLKALRSASRFFDTICQRFLYRQLNLLLDLTDEKLEKIQECFIIPKWSHIQSISIYLDTYEPVAPGHRISQAQNVASIVAQCRNLTSLALYYQSPDVEMTPLKDVLISLITNGRLSSLGIYSDRLMHYSEDHTSGEIGSLAIVLDALALDERVPKNLRVLDIYTQHIPARTFELIRTKMTGLTSLTLRRSLAGPSFTARIWDIDQQPQWRKLIHLTRLQLGNFEPGHAGQIPSLVGHLPALKDLVISACGKDSFATILRPSGWSRHPDAICNMRQPLTSFAIEHMDDYELYELGLIPTITLIVTTVKRHHLLTNLRRDAEIFPGIKVLRLAPLKSALPTHDQNEAELQKICATRGITIRRDARPNWTCVCTSDEGY